MNTNNDSTEARTGNTAAEQAVYWRGFEEAQLNAQHNAKVQAGHCCERAQAQGIAVCDECVRENEKLREAWAAPSSTVADEGAEDEWKPWERDFEAWWENHGQYCRAGGGQYEKTFAYHAYEAALASRPAPAAGDARDAITLPIAAARMIRREYLPSNPRRMSHVAVRDAVEQFLCALQAAEAAIAASQQGGE